MAKSSQILSVYLSAQCPDLVMYSNPSFSNILCDFGQACASLDITSMSVNFALLPTNICHIFSEISRHLSSLLFPDI
jgi:hypothetical protein